MTKLIFGCGYLGSRVARLWREQGAEVVAVTRSEERAAEFRQQGLSPLVADVTRPESLRQLPAAETVLVAVGFDRQRYDSIRSVYVDGLKSVLRALPPAAGRIIYISSTGVYGQTDGSEVDGDSPAQPASESGQACLDAEHLLVGDPVWGPRSVRLRLAGIYGPGRIPLQSKLQAGEPIPAAAEGWLNLIHVEDAARVVLAAEFLQDLPALFTVSDGHAAKRREYYQYLAELIGAPAPTFTEPDPNSRSGQRARSDKRISNRRMMESLEVTLAYPTFREGLAASL